VEIHRRRRRLGDRDDHHPSGASMKPRQNALPVVLANYIARQAGEMARVCVRPCQPGRAVAQNRALLDAISRGTGSAHDRTDPTL
jgi:hypothetical protein